MAAAPEGGRQQRWPHLLRRAEKTRVGGKHGTHGWRGIWRASRNGGLEGEFGEACKMEAHLEGLLQLSLCT
jgi:hypothetical protein